MPQPALLAKPSVPTALPFLGCPGNHFLLSPLPRPPPLQDCLCDEAPGVQAVGLDCVALLCEADVLEFYAAWRAVHRHAPRLPEHPAAAAAWVSGARGGGVCVLLVSLLSLRAC